MRWIANVICGSDKAVDVDDPLKKNKPFEYKRIRRKNSWHNYVVPKDIDLQWHVVTKTLVRTNDVFSSRPHKLGYGNSFCLFHEKLFDLMKTKTRIILMRFSPQVKPSRAVTETSLTFLKCVVQILKKNLSAFLLERNRSVEGFALEKNNFYFRVCWP